jgi:hypothetical protein
MQGPTLLLPRSGLSLIQNWNHGRIVFPQSRIYHDPRTLCWYVAREEIRFRQRLEKGSNRASPKP